MSRFFGETGGEYPEYRPAGAPAVPRRLLGDGWRLGLDRATWCYGNGAEATEPGAPPSEVLDPLRPLSPWEDLLSLDLAVSGGEFLAGCYAPGPIRLRSSRGVWASAVRSLQADYARARRADRRRIRDVRAALYGAQDSSRDGGA